MGEGLYDDVNKGSGNGYASSGGSGGSGAALDYGGSGLAGRGEHGGMHPDRYQALSGGDTMMMDV